MLILVNELDHPIGTAGKMEVHREGLLHRAFSVFVFNTDGKLLLQKRAEGKYHSAGLWTNTCCSHPAPGEDTLEAAKRRLQEEMGFVTELHKIFEFTYKADFDNGLTEHEYDHVFAGIYDGAIHPDKAEVQDTALLTLEEIEKRIQTSPSEYTEWFKIAFPLLKEWRASTGLFQNHP